MEKSTAQCPKMCKTTNRLRFLAFSRAPTEHGDFTIWKMCREEMKRVFLRLEKLGISL
jgi:hypothetical protein